MYTFLIIVAVGSFLVIVFSHIPGKMAAPFVPAFKKDVKRVVTFAQVQKGDIIYDLGCGDGRILVEAGRQGGNPVGVDIGPLQILISKMNCFFRGIKARFVLGDLFKADISDADIIFFYLLPEAIPRLRDKLAQECKKGCKVVSFCFKIPEWEPDKVDWPDKRMPVYVYKIGALRK